MKYTPLPVDLQINFFYRLKTYRPLYFAEALQRVVKELQIPDIDRELAALVPHDALRRLAAVSLRGEVAFPVPVILKHEPKLLGYYRLLYGLSQKEFYDKGPFGRFKAMEVKGRISGAIESEVDELCRSLIQSASQLITAIDEPSAERLNELQLLTAGAQYRGSRNNEIGQEATQQVFEIMKAMLKKHVAKETSKAITVKNASGRKVDVRFAADPDIEVVEHLSKGKRTVLSVEIKGGADASNIHNRVGEAEKSHVKAKARGCHEFVTIVNVNLDVVALKAGSPTTSHFYHLDQLLDNASDEYEVFKDLIASVVGVKL